MHIFVESGDTGRGCWSGGEYAAFLQNATGSRLGPRVLPWAGMRCPVGVLKMKPQLTVVCSDPLGHSERHRLEYQLRRAITVPSVEEF